MRIEVHCFQHLFHRIEMPGLLIFDLVNLAKASFADNVNILVVAFAFLFNEVCLRMLFYPARNRYLLDKIEHFELIPKSRGSYLLKEEPQEPPLRLLFAFVLSVIFCVYEYSSYPLWKVLSGRGIFLNARLLSCTFLWVYFFSALLASFLDFLEVWVCMQLLIKFW